jgi:hypothetical protein
MKSKLIKTAVGTILALLLLFGAARFFVSGQEKETESPPVTFENSRQSIEGVWQTTVTQRNCQTGEALRTFRGLLTFNQGGTISETSAAASSALRSPGHGVWEKESRSSYSGSFIFLRFNTDGSFAGTQKPTQTFVLRGSSGNEFESTGSVQNFDASGNLTGNGCATSVGTRFE